MVSRYEVGEIVIAGLAVGLVGTIYLAYGLFNKPIDDLRRLLIVMAFGLLATLITPTLYQFGPQLPLGRFTWLVFGVIGVLGGTIVAGDSPEHLRRQIISSIASLVSLLICDIGFAYYVYVLHKEMLASVLYWAGIFIGVLILLRVAAISTVISERWLQIVGFVLTVLGIATQFLPPVLDVLGIKVV